MTRTVMISDIKLPFTAPPEEAFAIADKLLLHPAGARFHIAKRSLDARKRNDIRFVYTVTAEFNGDIPLDPPDNGRIRLCENEALLLKRGTRKNKNLPVVAGFGPAGMFAGLVLAKCGMRPIIIEKGTDVDTRVADVQKFWRTGELSTGSNVQFGEGGAGTFSDGKLTTRINDSRCGFILEQFVRHGAPKGILFEAKPHVGTDNLRDIVKGIREEIIALGGEVRFNTSLIGLTVNDGKLTGIITSGGEIEAETLVLAPGHSARDIFSMLYDTGVPLSSKPFSVGVRIEHLQSEIDKALYGDLAGHPLLPKGEYLFSHKRGDRAVYTFCMCPGGIVVPAASEEGMLVTNGMSLYARDGVNANAAIAVSVGQADFGSGVLDGVLFQQELERAAYDMGGGAYKAPIQSSGLFLAGNKGYVQGKVNPSYACGVAEGDFSKLFPTTITAMLQEGIRIFGSKLRGFDADDAVLTGVESRTSSPVRIVRDDNLQSAGLRGLYPCGEGAGYAGGIMSAAADGIRIAQAILSEYTV